MIIIRLINYDNDKKSALQNLFHGRMYFSVGGQYFLIEDGIFFSPETGDFTAGFLNDDFRRGGIPGM